MHQVNKVKLLCKVSLGAMDFTTKLRKILNEGNLTQVYWLGVIETGW
jgi:hypothetical protein